LPGLVVGAACLVSCVGWIVESWDSDTTVEMPTDRERQEITVQLARATERQGICYGWWLSDDGVVDASGSNLGPYEPVTDDPGRCPRWVEVRATIRYDRDVSSYSSDEAAIEVAASPDIDPVDRIEGGLFLLNLDEPTFLDDPARSIGRAALALPLLVADWVPADALPVARPAAAAPPPLADVGRDFWWDGPFFAVGASVLLAAAVAFAVLGSRVRRAPAGPPEPYDRPRRIGGLIRRATPVRAPADPEPDREPDRATGKPAGRPVRRRRRRRRRKGGRP
jgi:hypothetical protein